MLKNHFVMNLFLPESGLVIWMLIAFTAVFIVLAKFAWPVILRMIQTRQDHIADSLRKADEANEALAGLEQKGKDIIAAANAEQLAMVKQTKELNDKMIAEAKQRAKAEADKIIDEAREQIKRDKEHAIEEIRQEVAALSIGIAESILRRELTNKAEQNKYIDRLLQEQQKGEPLS